MDQNSNNMVWITMTATLLFLKTEQQYIFSFWHKKTILFFFKPAQQHYCSWNRRSDSNVSVTRTAILLCLVQTQHYYCLWIGTSILFFWWPKQWLYCLCEHNSNYNHYSTFKFISIKLYSCGRNEIQWFLLKMSNLPKLLATNYIF